MEEDDVIGHSLSDDELDEITGGVGGLRECAVPEVQFPSSECCSKLKSLSGTAYEKRCSKCSIWTSPPDSSSLAITHIIECMHFGYGVRVQE